MNSQKIHLLDRRAFLAGTASAAVASALLRPSSALAAAAPRSSSILTHENAREGSRDWQLTRVRIDPAAKGQNPREVVRSSVIEGYCSRQSVAAGEKLDIMVSTNPPSPFTFEIFRNGYYGGRGARLLTTLGPIKGRVQPDPVFSEQRLVECQWEPSATITIPSDWPSGVYLGRLTTLPESADHPYWQSYVVFIVRDDRPADILFQCSDNTWQSYNRWPGTYSLYDDGVTPGMTSKLDISASFDRPYGKYRQIYDNPQSVGSGEWLCWEFPLAYWLEQHGYDVSYCSNADLLTPDRGLKTKCFLSVGHDEYWDVRQYESVKRMIESGVSALFLCGNAVSGVTPLTPGTSGEPNRVMTRVGPFGGWSMASAGVAVDRDGKPRPAPGPDEGLLMGARNISPVNGGGDWIVVKPDHWMFEGTGMRKGDLVRGLVGWEYHGNPADLPGLEVVAEGTAWKGGTVAQHWTATYHPGPKNNFVFNSATIWWAQAMSSPPGHMLPWSHWNRPHGPDERVQRITRNLLQRALGRTS